MMPRHSSDSVQFSTTTLYNVHSAVCTVQQRKEDNKSLVMVKRSQMRTTFEQAGDVSPIYIYAAMCSSEQTVRSDTI